MFLGLLAETHGAPVREFLNVAPRLYRGRERDFDLRSNAPSSDDRDEDSTERKVDPSWHY
jgi:hypothetical protein